MGAQSLAEVHAKVVKHWHLFLFGLEGVGKSHLLAMLALLRLQAQIDDPSELTVCFIPDLGSCANDRYGLWKALIEAFVCDPVALVSLAQIYMASEHQYFSSSPISLRIAT